MTIFLRLLADEQKAVSLKQCCDAIRCNAFESRVFETDPESFSALPGSPFAYWIEERVRDCFRHHDQFEADGRTAKAGLQSSDNFRFLRLGWEILDSSLHTRWFPYAKGGAFSRYYSDVHLCLLWEDDGRQAKAWAESQYGGGQHWSRNLRNVSYMFRPGITWSTRTTSKLSVRVFPKNCAFDTKGCAAFVDGDDQIEILGLLAITNSEAFARLIEVQIAAGDSAARSYDTGLINRTPIPRIGQSQQIELSKLARKSWSLMRSLNTVQETSRVFVLPAALRARLGAYDPASIEANLSNLQAKIDEQSFALYGFSDADRAAALEPRR